MPTFLVIALLTAIAVLLWRGLVLLRRIASGVEAMTSEVRDLRLKSRTRIGTVSTPPAPGTSERELFDLRRLGRASVGKRVVVGGDPDSPQHSNLGKVAEEDG